MSKLGPWKENYVLLWLENVWPTQFWVDVCSGKILIQILITELTKWDFLVRIFGTTYSLFNAHRVYIMDFVKNWLWNDFK